MKTRKILAFTLSLALMLCCVPLCFVASAETTFAKIDGQNLIALGDNILTKAEYWSSHDPNQQCGGVPILTDGIYSGYTEGHSKETVADRWDYRTWSTGWIVYIGFHFNGTASISSILYATDAGAALDGVRVFITDDSSKKVSENPGNYTPVGETTVNQNKGGVFTLDEPVSGKYLTFEFTPGKPYQYAVILSELAATGTAPEKYIDNSVNLIAGKLPTKEYRSYWKEPGKEIKGTLQVDPEQSAVRATDGILTADGGSNANFRYCPSVCNGLSEPSYKLPAASNGGQVIAPGYPWLVVVYHLGGMADVTSMTLTSSNENGYYIAGAEFYVGDKISTLFDPANRVLTTGGEKTLIDEYEEEVFDPSTDVLKVAITNEERFTGVSGRYAAFVITRPFPVARKGYGFARIAELEVKGVVTQAEEPFDPASLTVTNADTGIKATFNQIDPDDTEFFKGLQLKVTKSALPQGVATDFGDNWFHVDSEVFTLELLDKDGQTVTDNDLGDRYWRIEVPTDTGYFRMAAELIDGELVRVRDARSNADKSIVYIGNKSGAEKEMIYGNNHSFVLLRYNDEATIAALDGEMPGKAVAPYVTDGVQAEQTATVPWIAIAAAAVLLALAGWLAWRLARRAHQ